MNATRLVGLSILMIYLIIVISSAFTVKLENKGNELLKCGLKGQMTEAGKKGNAGAVY